MNPDFQRNPWKHPAAWKAHLVRHSREDHCGVPSAVATRQCGWAVCAEISQPPFMARVAIDQAVNDHWLAVVAEAEAVPA